MFAVIFKAEIKVVDDAYWEMVAQLRKLACETYGCQNLTTVQEGVHELTVSYWESMEQIAQWRNDPLHKQAQRLGRKRWYRSYTVDVTEVKRHYKSS